ncbi:MAG: TrmJ/YjtD family RNA methyltransferase [Candidatus Aureabacteria bacterium]|nr:TrmJ/YjtD family RNA methyltransferase [Candidatus Auribacterota bacterium]
MAFIRKTAENIHILLVRPRHVGNIGSSARAMKNTGFSQLVLVDPAPYDVPETYMMGWNSEDVIKNALVFSSLKEAVASYHLVVGTTRRKGKGRENLYPLEELLEEILSVAGKNRVAVLFGTESTGLLNSDLKECHKLAYIDTSTVFPSLNLSQAVLVVCYELHKLLRREKPKSRLRPAGKAHLDLMYTHIDHTLKVLGYDVKGNRPLRQQILKRIRAVFSRALLEKKDVQMVRGICQQIEKHLSRIKR